MAINFEYTLNAKAPAKFIADKILGQLEQGRKVLWFATGGSSMEVGVEVSKIIREHPHQKLTVTLTDERYGELSHSDSNWQQLLAKDFVLPQARLLPILTGDDILVTTDRFNTILTEELEKADYRIGLFGVGADGHTAGILPGSEVVNTLALAYGYNGAKYERITMTPVAIIRLNEAVVFMQGQDKWPIIDDLKEKNLDLLIQPAQILKKVPVLTIFSDYEK